MSLSNSRWAATKQKEDNEKSSQTHPPSATTPSTSKYIPPNRRPNASPLPPNSLKSKPSSNIIINASDRTLSKKFSSPQTIHQNPKMAAVINSFDHSLHLHHHPDPMSLVPSPSRGIAVTNTSKDSSRNDQQENQIPSSSSLINVEQDLTKYEFQVEFFKWFITKKLKIYRKRYPNPLKLFLNSSLEAFYNCNHEEFDNHRHGGIKKSKMKDYDGTCFSSQEEFKSQKDQTSSLVREIRKLREGIFASRRRDSFAIVVYEVSAELALESLDFAQLNTLLSTLVFDLYGQITMSQHQNVRKELNHDSKSTADPWKEAQSEKDEVEAILEASRGTEEEILNRRLMFARVLLLLPIVTRLDLSRFLDQFPHLCHLFKVDGGDQVNLTDHSIHLDHSSSSTPPQLLELGDLFKLILRKNYVRINRNFIKPKLTRICRNSQTQDDPTVDSKNNESIAKRVPWDDLLYLNLLNVIRSRLIWNSMVKSYHHLTLNDDKFIFNALCLEFSRLDIFFCNNNSNVGQRREDDENKSCLHVHQAVDHWLLLVKLERKSNGTIQFKK